MSTRRRRSKLTSGQGDTGTLDGSHFIFEAAGVGTIDRCAAPGEEKTLKKVRNDEAGRERRGEKEEEEKELTCRQGWHRNP